MNKYIYFVLFIAISGCVPHHHTGLVKYPEVQPSKISSNKPGYNDAYKECERIAVAANIDNVNKDNTLNNATTGATVGALTGVAFGADVLSVAGVGAATGALSADRRQPQYDQIEYKRIMLDCMRHKGFEVY